MIQGIEEFGSQLQLDSLRDGAGLGQGDVDIGQTRTAEHVAGYTVSPIARIVYRIELGEPRIRSAVIVVIIVSKGTFEETIGIKDEVPGDLGGRGLADRACAVG